MDDNSAHQSGPSEFKATTDRFNGKIVDVSALPDNDYDFASMLHYSMEKWRAEKFRGIWITIPIKKSSFMAIAADVGFNFHHAEGEEAVLTAWLPTNEPNKLPRYAFHTIGVGGMVLNEKNEILVVREKYNLIGSFWKLPGGLADAGEELGQTAVREVEEETGIKCEFLSLVAVRHAHAGLLGRCSDLYFIARLRPLTQEIQFDPGEIADARWMPIDEYCTDTYVTSFNQWIGTLARDHTQLWKSTEMTASVQPTWNNRGTYYAYAVQSKL